MRPRHVRVPATDGFSLAATLVGEPHARGVVLISSATAVPRRYYADFAAFLAERGWLVATYDYRGVGDSKPAPPGAAMRHWGERDMAGMISWLAKEHPDAAALVGIGHSAGGQLVCMTDESARFSALVGVAAQSGYWRHWSGAGRARRYFDWHVGVPVVANLFGKVPKWAGLGAELPKGVALEWARWCRHPDYLLRDDSSARRARYDALRVPFLSWSFSDDDYGPEAAADWLAAQLRNAKVERRHVEPREVDARRIGHFGFFRAAFRGTLWERTSDRLDDIIGAPSSL